MIKPPLNELMKKVDCRYTLVATLSKRARQIVDDPSKAFDVSMKPVSAAVDDLMYDRVKYTRTVEGIK